VAQYSEFINFPIYLWTSKETEVEVPDEEAEAAAAAAREDRSEEDIEDEGAPGCSVIRQEGAHASVYLPRQRVKEHAACGPFARA